MLAGPTSSRQPQIPQKRMSTKGTKIIRQSIKLQEGPAELPEGTKELQEGPVELPDGTKELYEGTMQPHEQTVQLQEKKKQLQEGTMELQEQNPKLQESNPQLYLEPYYAQIKVGKTLLTHFSIQLFFELEKERGRTPKCMNISKSKRVEDVGIMEEKMKNTGEEMDDLIFVEANIRDNFQKQNKMMKSHLQEKEEQLSTMASLSMKSIHCRHP